MTSNRHRLKIGAFSREWYCRRCGRAQPWPCPEATAWGRLMARFGR